MTDPIKKQEITNPEHIKKLAEIAAMTPAERQALYTIEKQPILRNNA